MLDYIIIGVLAVILVLVIISLFKNINEGKITERLGNLENNVTRELGDFKTDITRNLNDDFNKQSERMDNRLNLINDRVNERLDENFEKTNKTFNNVLEKLAKIDEAQKKIDSLSTDIVSLQGILTDKKSRGIFGEVNLTHILSSVFGDSNDKVYQLQYTFENGSIADAVLYLFSVVMFLFTKTELALTIWEMLTIVSGPILLFAMLHLSHDLNQPIILRNAVLSFMTCVCLLTAVAHVVNICVTRRLIAEGVDVPTYFQIGQWPSVEMAVDYLAWGFLWGLHIFVSGVRLLRGKEKRIGSELLP